MLLGMRYDLSFGKLPGVVLFPEATLPLRIVDPKFIAAVEKALNQVDAPCTIGVVC